MKKNLLPPPKIRYGLGKGLLLGTCLLFVGADLVAKPAKTTAFFQTTQAEKITVKGKVIGDDKGGLPGVTIIAGNTPVALTNIDGNFELEVNKGIVLTFTYIGFMQEKVTVNSPQANLTVTMTPDAKQLSEVVVTALGIKRDEKALGFATSTVKGEELTDARSNNWTNALSGRVAGLNMVKSGGGPGASNRIILRGENNLGGNDEALIVIDGVVMGGSGRTSGVSNGNSSYLSSTNDSPQDYGSGLSDINPDDIESVTVLKGPGAAALYGARGSNGAIIITTKSGKPRVKGLGVTINSNSEIETISRWPEYQYEYGQGTVGENYYSYNASEDGASTRSTSSAWGRKFNPEEMYYQFDPVTRTKSTVRTPWVPYKDNRKDFFETGRTLTNTVTIDGGTAQTNARLSFTNLQNNWIIPNTGYTRNTIAASINNKITDKLQIATKVNYTNKYSDNLPSTGYNNQTIMYFMNLQAPNVDLDWYKNYWVPGQEGVNQLGPFSSLIDNPYLIANEMLNRSDRNGVVGNVQATYNFNKDLSLLVRTAIDFAYESRSQQRPKSTEQFKEGMYRTQNIYTQETNSDFLLRYGRKFGEKFESNISVGGSQMRNHYKRDENQANRLNFPGVFTLANSKDLVVPRPYAADFAVNSFYGLGSFSFNDYLFLDLTARQDWTSTLATPGVDRNLGFFYPSASLSAVISEMLPMPAAITFVKLRGSVSSTGSGGTDPFLTAYTYSPEPIFPGGVSNPTLIANPNLQPLRTSSVEIGADLRFLNNRVGLDVAVYHSKTKDQILKGNIDRSAGFNQALVNAGLVENNGIEVQANGSPLKNKTGLNWNVYATFTANRNKVVSLADSMETLPLSTGPRGSIEARPGGSMGDLYGLGYLRAPDGQIVYNEQGYPILDQNVRLLGKTLPDWRGSIGNEFKYKQFRLNIMFDGQFGAKAYSLTHSTAAEGGKLKKTLPGRYNGIIGNGVIQNADGTYRQNDIVAENIWTYYSEHFKRDNVEANLFSTDYIKLREVRFDYNLPADMVKRLKLQRASIGVYGRDLFILSNWPAYDPEFGTISNGKITAGFEVGQFPATRTMGLNLTLGI